MKTIILTIAAVALTAAAAHAESPPIDVSEVVEDDTPACLSIFGGWSDDDRHSALDVYNDCDGEARLTCPIEGQCRLGSGEVVDEIVIASASGATVYVPYGSGEVPWRVGDLSGAVYYEPGPTYGYECGLSAFACTASPGMTRGDLGWFAAAFFGLVLLRRRSSRRAQAAA